METRTILTLHSSAASAAPPVASTAAASGAVGGFADPQSLKDAILRSLDDDKGEEIIAFDLRGRSPLADWMIIATGRSTRQVASMAQNLRERLGRHGMDVSIEGLQQADWVLVDAGDVIVHIFRPEVRSFYQIERLWAEPVQASA